MERMTEEFYEKEYEEKGLDAQRRWPNEEFARFMGRTYFKLEPEKRKNTRICEVGCGSGANLRLLIDEGFDTYGIDFSRRSIAMAKQIYGEKACLEVANMMELPYPNDSLDAVVDIFSSNCLNEKNYRIFCKEIYRVLRKGGVFFSYTPSKNSMAFTDFAPSVKLDESTLDGIRRIDSPYYGNFYPFRFTSVEDVKNIFCEKEFFIRYMEKITKSYNDMNELFEFLVFEIEKK